MATMTQLNVRLLDLGTIKKFTRERDETVPVMFNCLMPRCSANSWSNAPDVTQWFEVDNGLAMLCPTCAAASHGHTIIRAALRRHLRLAKFRLAKEEPVPMWWRA